MKSPFTRMLYGGDYNPNQWPREVWEEDMRLFKLAHINSATVNVFSWAKIQPSEERYDFEELDAIMDRLGREGHEIVLGTSTAAMPGWMFMRYPEVGRVDFEGRRHRFGQRHNACPNSPVYQKYAAALAEQLAIRYKDHPQLSCWHVNNEYGGACYCENCEKAFRVWLRQKYGTIEEVNRAWNMDFWGHRVYSWEEIVVPNLLSEGIDRERTAFGGISLDYCRFNSDSMLKNFIAERDAIRRHDQKTPITTNMMSAYKPLDYFRWAREIDIISWDNYPAYNTPWGYVAMMHDLMRGLKRQPFMLMEQTPSQQNWQAYNALKRPGQMRAQSYQSIAHGADSIQFFQLRRSVGACEKLHGAVISHAGHENTRVFREVTQLGKELESVGPQLLGADSPAQVGLVFDWDNFWSVEFSSGPSRDLKYLDQVFQYYRCFYERGIPVDIIPVDADLSAYRLVLAPLLYMVKDGMGPRLERYVAEGGRLVTGFMSGIVDDSDNVHLGGYPGPLRKLCGVWAEEIDALAPGRTNSLRFADRQEATCSLLCDVLHLEGAESLADYTSDFYAGGPAVTRNRYGQGEAYYVGSQLEPKALGKLLSMASDAAGVKPLLDEETALEVTRRRRDGKDYFFIMNFSGRPQALPQRFAGETDLLSGEALPQGRVLAPYDTLLVCLEADEAR